MHLHSFTFKYTHGDFIVKETLPFTPSGHGPLIYLNIQKSGKTTHDLLAFVMKTTGLRREAIGICGLKDKRGITQQRMSLYKRDLSKTGGINNLLGAMQKTQYKLLQMTEDERFLTLGSNKGNQFLIRIRQQGNQKADVWAQQVNQALEKLKKEGVPNFFGEQRFGVTRNNRKLGQSLLLGEKVKIKKDLPGRDEKKFKIQAFCSYVFNMYLLQRLKDRMRNQSYEGDIAYDIIKDQYLNMKANDPRLQESQYVLTGPVFGNDLLQTRKDETSKKNPTPATLKEREVFKSFNLTEKEMKKCGERKLWGTRRPLKMDIQDLKRRNENNESIIINITLGSGCYASTFLEQLDRTILGPSMGSSRPTPKAYESNRKIGQHNKRKYN